MQSGSTLIILKGPDFTMAVQSGAGDEGDEGECPGDEGTTDEGE